MDQGNTAFILLAAALVLLMTPGLAFFYGGLVKAKSVISMMMMSFGAIGLIGVLWAIYGYAIAFPGAEGTLFPWAIDTGAIGLANVLEAPEGAAFPPLAFVAFQATFAIITVALVSGAIADRAKFGAWMVFAGIWATLVYFPVASWVFNFGLAEEGGFAYGGWTTHGLQEVFGLGVIDFAGGTAVHINAGAAALALALVLGKRVGFAKGAHVPHNPPFVLLGAGLLWFGWFGFNAGSELAADNTAALAFVNTIVAPAAALLAWLVVEKIRDGKPTSIGAASGAVAGLVAITPACGSLTPMWAILLGVIAGAVCALAIDLKFKLGFDDSLDVVGIHLVGGLIGTLYLGFFATGTGIFTGGDGTQLLVQAIAALAVLVYSFVLAFIIGFVIEKTMGFRVKNEDEIAGIDTVVHGEEGYVLADTK
ncbi:Amt family ammonium transporter [Microbacteriaceae bacterium SG_E_30_P1]|uniref:Ammonium transporter n=1 Tax=Antiquaquibacter oligotrophicus TaxID=2880260 RepID=A0ABT6KLY2_9MICO|nr:ammonium transporter [Antiquaquibacter oligotrophicus]MDH6181020.1 Amt family ammonium transporter [Antiquaquibacter oligotrophicus]UDF13281.1 ammonium transporter [Antiquaquibacter oligotrophicus]